MHLVHPGPHILLPCWRAGTPSPQPWFFFLSYHWVRELRGLEVSANPHTGNPPEKELDLDGLFSLWALSCRLPYLLNTTCLPHPLTHTSPECNSPGWQGGTLFRTMLSPLLKNKWAHWSVHWHLSETMFIKFMNMEMGSHLPESLTPRKLALSAIGENLFPWSLNNFYPEEERTAYSFSYTHTRMHAHTHTHAQYLPPVCGLGSKV